MLNLRLFSSRCFSSRVAQLGRRLIQSSAESYPKPNQTKKLRVLFFVNKHNGLSQRVAQELKESNHAIDSMEVCEINEPSEMAKYSNEKKPDLILCPFLTKRVPEEVWSSPTIPCLIVHPGIEGDRGASSLDWALKDQWEYWGVTVMQAAQEMDAGDIWSTKNFKIDRPNINTLTKSSLYSNEVTSAAVQNCLQALENFIENVKPRPLDYSQPQVTGSLRPNMKKEDRRVNWELPMEEVARLVRMSDSSPGAIAQFRQRDSETTWSSEMRIFGAHLEEHDLCNVKGVPGEIIGHRNDAVLVKCGQGAVWISHIKKNKLKLPATFWLSDGPFQELPTPAIEVPHKEFPKTFQEIWTTISPEGVCSVNFNFLNGAMSTRQCRQLESVLKNLEQDCRVKVIVLKGGYNFFSNGIHLNVIESARNPSQESWANINGINDVIKCIFTSKKPTVSALQGNAGAGGAMMALASDIAVSREGVVLTPCYHAMHLYGSEYHTFFLPQRVGIAKAQELLSSDDPLLSTEAVRIGFLDDSSGKTVHEFGCFIDDFAKELSHPSLIKEHQRNKRRFQDHEWFQRLEDQRHKELFIMANNFSTDEYHNARKAFVYH